MKGEAGQALPLAMMAMAIGMLVISPFLGHAGTNMLSSRTYGETIAATFACDAGVEHAIWGLTYGSLADQLSGPGSSVTYQLDENINGLSTSITVTANTTGGGGGEIGDIGDTVLDSLEFDTSDGYTPSIIHVSGDIYAIVYRGPGSDGFIKTVSINSSGDIGAAVIDSFEFDTSDGFEPDVIHIQGDIYAIAYRGPSTLGYIKTLSISTGGAIDDSFIDTLVFDSSLCYTPDIIHVSGNTYAIAYRGPSSRGYLKTVTIAPTGDIGAAAIDTLIFDTTLGYDPSIINVSGNTYAIAYRGSGGRGYLKTVAITPGGDIGASPIDSFVFDAASGYEPDIAPVSCDYYAITYRGAGNAGTLKTIVITAAGDIAGSVTDTLVFDSYCYQPDIMKIAGEAFAVVYRGPSNDGFVKTFSIDSTGDIGGLPLDTLEFDTSNGYDPGIAHVSGNVYAIAYRGMSNDGFVTTLSIRGSAALATWEILATAGGRSIRAFVETASENASIISWRVE